MTEEQLRIACEEAEHLFDLADADRDHHKYGSQAWWDAQAAASKAFVNMVRAERLHVAESGFYA